MATNNGSPHLQIRHNLSGLYLADWKWLHPIVIAFNTPCPVEFYIQWCGALHWTHWGSYFEKLICPALEINFLKKLPQLVALQIFQSSYLSHGESLNHNILWHYHDYHKTHIEHIFENIIYITKKAPNLVAKILATKFGFVLDCLITNAHYPEWYPASSYKASAVLE